jgi:hypothetical protein
MGGMGAIRVAGRKELKIFRKSLEMFDDIFALADACRMDRA